VSSLTSTNIPENIRRCMPPETRKELAPTQPEADARHNAKCEKQLQEQIANLLRQRNITFFRQRMDKRTTGKVGQPDFVFAVKGQACACEVKMPGGVLTRDQFSVLEKLQDNGWRTWIARSLMDFVVWLNDVEKEAGND